MKNNKYFILSLLFFLFIQLSAQESENFSEPLKKDTLEEFDFFKKMPLHVGLDLKSFGHYEFSYLQEKHLATYFKIGILKISAERNAFLNFEAVNKEVVMDHLIHKNIIIGLEPSYIFKSRMGRHVLGLHFGLFKIYQKRINRIEKHCNDFSEEFFLVLNETRDSKNGYSMLWGMDVFLTKKISLGLDYRQDFFKNEFHNKNQVHANQSFINGRINTKIQYSF